MENSFLKFRILIALVFAAVGTFFSGGAAGEWISASVGAISGFAVGYLFGLATFRVESPHFSSRILRGTLFGALAGVISGGCTATMLGGPVLIFVGGIAGAIPGLFLGLGFSIMIANIRKNNEHNGFTISFSKTEDFVVLVLYAAIFLLFILATIVGNINRHSHDLEEFVEYNPKLDMHSSF